MRLNIFRILLVATLMIGFTSCSSHQAKSNSTKDKSQALNENSAADRHISSEDAEKMKPDKEMNLGRTLIGIGDIRQ